MKKIARLAGVAVLIGACSSTSQPAASVVGSPVAAASPGAPTASATPSASGASPIPAASASPTVDLPAIVRIETLPGVTTISGGAPDWVTLAGRYAWAAGVDPGIGRYDLATGEARPGVATGGICSAMDAAFGSLWVPDCDGTLLRIDPAAGKIVASIKLPGPPVEESSVAAGEGSVWVTLGEPIRLVRIDPRTNKIATTVDAPGVTGGLRAGVGGLWLASAQGTVFRLDAKTGKTIASIPAGSAPRFTAIGAGSVWVLNQGDGTVSRIDGKTNGVVATIVVSSRSVQGGDMAFGGGFAWARVSDSLVAQIDPATNRVVRRLGNPAGSGSVAADDDAVWISAHDVSSLWRIALK